MDLFIVLAFIGTVTNSFFWNKYWSFGERDTKTISNEAIKFFSISAAVAVINTGIIQLIVNVIGAPAGFDPKIWANIALALTIITAFLGNFFSYKYIVFSDKK